MIPWVVVGAGKTPDGTQLELRRRGDEFVILAGGQRLMGSRMTGSEVALAKLALGHLRDTQQATVLIGGLGCGFTLRAALDLLPASAQVIVAELVPVVVEWNRGSLGACAGNPLLDARVRVVTGDVRAMLGAAAAYDAVVLDVDNGPQAFTQQSNSALYSNAGLKAARKALGPGGVFALWSRGPDVAFAQRLGRAGFRVTEHIVRAGASGKGERNCVWVAARREP